MGPEVIIGRSPECQITIEDPLVSRQHARIVMRGDEARVVDLGSRNGVRVNGTLIRGEAVLAHNDRVRLGTQDLVFLVVDEQAERLSRSTGYMMHCTSCGRPFPGESGVCPHCGASTDPDETGGYDTITGLVLEPPTSWTFQLLGEVIVRALNAGRAPEAERMVQRAAREVDERTRHGIALEAKQLAMISMYAVRLSVLQQSPRWAEWTLTLHRQAATLPSVEVLDELEKLDAQSRDTLKPLLEGFLMWWTAHRGALADDDEKRRSARVRALAGAA